MQGSRALARVTKDYSTNASPSRSVPWSLPWRDLPILSRYAGHLILGLMLIALAYGVRPVRLNAPSISTLLGRESAAPVSELATAPTYAYAQPANSARYLEPGTIPFTIRTWGETLPMLEEPRRMARTSVTVYTVQPGDTTLGIAQRFGLRGTSLLYANDSLADQPDLLRIGQELNILPVDGALHTVAAGESLSAIATRYKVDVEIITGYPGNNMSEPYSVTAGQQLIIPGGVRPFVPRAVTTYQASTPRTTTTAGATGTGQMVWPMSGQITQRYWAGHRAIDIAAPRGTPILAADGGTVVAAHFARGYGRMVVIDHGNGLQTLYAHMDAYYVQVGQSVARGAMIGRCGSTGNSTGPHLHFEVRRGGSLLNPLGFLP